MIYALGRGLEPSDMPVVRRIVRKAGQNSYRLSTIINEIIESAPFQMRTRLEPNQPSNTVARATTVGAVGTTQARQRAALSNDRPQE